MTSAVECPKCKEVLALPEIVGLSPIRCPVCDSRYIIEGRQIAHLEFTDYYKLLGISPKSSHEEIKKAVRAKILEHHPDHNPKDPTAPARFMAVIVAKEILTDSSKRATYDRVFWAEPLILWDEYKNKKADRFSKPRRENPIWEGSGYEEMVATAKAKSLGAIGESINNLLEELEKRLAGKGEFGSRESVETFMREDRQGLQGAWFLGLLCFFIGVRYVSQIYLYLCIAGALIGWFLGNFRSQPAKLLFMAIRIFLGGVVAGIFTSGAYRNFFYSLIPDAVFIYLALFAMTGAVLMQAPWIVYDRKKERRPAERQALYNLSIIGSVTGAVISAIAYLFLNELTPIQNSMVLVWLGLFSAYVVSDTRYFTPKSFDPVKWTG